MLSSPRLHVIALVLLLAAAPAAADVRDFIGKPLADVRIDAGGVAVTDVGVLELIETRVGEPLAIERIRQTIQHLVGLGRFEDVRVYAEAAPDRPDAVVLRYVVTPLQRITRLAIEGAHVLSESALRAEISERFGSTPAASQADDIVAVLRTFYADRGYRSPRIQPRVVASGAAERATLAIAIDAGPRTTLSHVAVEGQPPIPAPQLMERIGLRPGMPYDREAIEARLDDYEEELRGQRHYEAAVESAVVFSDADHAARLTIRVEPGPRIRVEFAGDPLPANRRESLVPIAQERSVDLDLLEDGSRNIERFLRQEGYHAAQASYVRESAGAETVITFTVNRGPLHRLESADVTGNAALTRFDVAPLLKLQPGEPYVDSRVATVASAVSELYRVRGFARAVVKPDVIVLPERSDAGAPYRPVRVRFVVSEGVATTVGSAAIEGASAIPQAEIEAALSLTGGKPFYRPLLDSDRDAIEQLYRNRGFQEVLVQADSTLAADGSRIDLRWQVREGAQTLVDHVLVTGNLRTSSGLIRREIPLQPGRPLGAQDIVESQRRLSALGLFRRVRITELPHGVGSQRDVLVEVEETDPTSVSIGGGVEAGTRLRRVAGGATADRIEIAPRGFFEVSRRNLWGKNRSISLLTRISFRPRDPAVDSPDPQDEGGYGFNEYRVVGTFREPRPFDRPGDAQLTAFLEQAIRTSYNFSRRGVRGEYARRIGSTLTMSGRYAFDYTRLFDEQVLPEDRLLVDRLFPQVRLSTFTGSVLRDSRNDVLDPARGTVVGLDGSLAPRFVGSEVGFAKAFSQAFVYRRLPGTDRFVVAAGARLGFAVGFERQVERRDENGQPVIGPDGRPVIDIVKELPASERFFAGGDTTVRGFVLDRLGAADTLDEQGYPRGGNGIVVLNLEVRAPYWKDMGLVGFLDAGNVFSTAGDVSLADLRPATGFGVRYRSPLGPLRVDIGFNLDRQLLRSGDRERGTVFHISLGQAF